MNQKSQDRLVAAVVGWIGAALLIVGTLLPARESTVFSGVADNTLIQSGRGIFYIAAGLAVAWRVYRTFTNRDKAGWVIFAGVWAAAWLAYDWTHGAEIYPVIGGQLDTTVAPEIAAAGIGLYVIALGSLLSFASGVALLKTKPAAAPAPITSPPTNRVTTCSSCRQIHDDTACPRCGTSAYTSKLAGIGSVMR